MLVIGVGRIETHVGGSVPGGTPMLAAWLAEVRAARWHRPEDVIAAFPVADVRGSDVTFVLSGGLDRVGVAVDYAAGVVLIRSVEVAAAPLPTTQDRVGRSP